MPIRVLIVDDSILFRTKMRLSLADTEIEVVGSAMDTLEATRLIEELRPDVITLDVEMPGTDGIRFLKQLLPKHSVPVIVVSSLPINVLDALDAGAVDFVRKPEAGDAGSLSRFAEELKSKVKIASQSKVRTKTVSPRSLTARLSDLASHAPRAADPDMVIAIGASTGGTEAIIEVVKDLPASAPSILVVQHMPPNFTDLYAKRLDKLCKMRAKEAQDGDRLAIGQILVAAGERHLTLRRDSGGYFVRSRAGEKISGHCPSVDVLFDSVAETAGANAVGILLTGMGADGAKGITRMRGRGCYTIGQDPESCVVYGMPMEAYKMGGIVRQLPLDQIGDELIYYLNQKAKEKR